MPTEPEQPSKPEVMKGAETMSPKLQSILNELEQSGTSEGGTVADCLNTIAQNDDEDMQTDAHILSCAREIEGWAKYVKTAYNKKGA